MAELVDAQVSGICVRKDVEVRVFFWAPGTTESRREIVGFRAFSIKNSAMIRSSAAIHLHDGDLPDDLDLGPLVAIDTETMGLNPHRDRLCLVQLSSGNGEAHLVQIRPEARTGISGGVTCRPCPNLRALLEDRAVTKLMHFGRFDVAVLQHALKLTVSPVICTKIAARLVRTFTDRHGLAHLCRELLGVDLAKHQQTSDWGQDTLTPEQLAYAASDVLHLHALWAKLEALLHREGRRDLAQACYNFLPARAELDLLGYEDPDIFSHRA